MICKRCGGDIDTRRRRSDGSVQCPHCKVVYRPRPNQPQQPISRNKNQNGNKRKISIPAILTFVFIIAVFAIIRTSTKFFSWIWLVFAGMIWLAVWLGIKQHKTTGEIIKIEIVDTVPRGRTSIVIFRETTASGLVRLVQHEAGSLGYQSELTLMNILENTEEERRKRAVR